MLRWIVDLLWIFVCALEGEDESPDEKERGPPIEITWTTVLY